MPQSLAYLLTHIVFSTKDRVPVLDPVVRPALHAYLATVARNADCECFRVGGVADHVHLALRLSRTLTMANLIEEIKPRPPNGSKPNRLHWLPLRGSPATVLFPSVPLT